MDIDRKHDILHFTAEYRNIAQSSPEPIIVYSQDTIRFVNEAALELIGAQHENEVVGKSILEFVHPDEWSAVRSQQKQLMQEGRSRKVIEKRWIRLDKRIVNVEVRAIQIVYNNSPGIMLLVRDITERKLMEESLKESELRYRRLLQLSPESIFIHSDGIIIYVNDAGIRLMGAESAEQLIGKPILSFVAGKKDAAKQWLKEAVSTENNPRFYEYQFIRSNGETFPGEAATVVVFQYLNTAVYQTTIRDITQRIQKEQFLRQSEKLAAIGQLAAGVAHEIRNPLTALIGFTRLLKVKREQIEQYTDIMLDELNRINSIVNEFMNLAKPQPISFKRNNAISMIDSLLPVVRSQANMCNVEVETEFNLSPLWIQGDENQLKQVFLNIMKNAIEAMPNGGRLTVSARQDKDSAVIVFTDNGIGIKKENIPKIGEPFFTTKEKGTGLGIMVSYNIIKAHNGQLHIVSEEGKGTAVSIKLPLKNTPPEAE
jgi:two-component system sporulation sensor kinase A